MRAPGGIVAAVFQALIIGSLAGPLAAQAPAYARPPGDTIRLREVTTSEITLTTPQGDVVVGSLHDAVIALAFQRGDTAHAWYESLAIETTTPQGTQRAETGGALGAPFTLHFDARGRIATLATPDFPQAVREHSDLRYQFDDLFLRLPAEPLRIGLTWADTIARDGPADEGHHSRRQAVVRYRVERDTIVDGTAALVIAMRQALRNASGGPVPGRPLTATAVQEGTDEGIVVWAPQAGRMLGRERTGELRGTVTYRGAQGEMTLDQRFRYRSRVETVRR